LEKGEADREDRLIQEQVERARQEAIEKQLDEADAATWPDTIKDEEGIKEEVDVEPSANTKSDSDQVDVKMEDVETSVPPEKKTAVITPITLPKPLTTNNINLSLRKPTNPLKSSNPLAASKKSVNPLKSAMKKEAKKPAEPPFNDNGKRSLPKVVEIMNEELERKRFREQRYNRDRDRDRYHRDHPQRFLPAHVTKASPDRLPNPHFV
jgi:hypothetical protein